MSDERYFRRLESELEAAREVAARARAQGRDPEPEIEIPAARDMADRVEKVLGIDGVADRIRELEGDHSREEAALAMVEDFVEGTVGDYDTDAAKIEGAVRTAVALLTEGVVAAPIEGIDLVEVLENDDVDERSSSGNQNSPSSGDGTEFINVYYAGPIRSAGGTAQALSVLVADYARSLLGLSEYDARTEEVDRYAEEVTLYDDETGLQYSPSDEEAKFIARHMPIMLDGEATSDGEVSGTRDIERVDTNGARGGMCLVLAEGIALKAPKIQRYTRELDEVEWPWLQDLIDGTIGEDDGDEADEDAGTDDDGDATDGADDDDAGDEPDGPPRAEPHKKYLRDLIAGRPVFSHPSKPGGFRLRYGRARNHGHATAGIHPATMHLVDDFLATGTQIKTELPGKAAGIVPVDSIEGPTVRLANGDVRRIDDAEEAKAVRNGVEAVLDIGEYLVNYGEFVENNHDLVPASYTVEWWVQELERTDADVRAMRDSPRVDLDDPDPGEALEWAREYDAPLHPAYTYLWHDVDPGEFERLAGVVAAGRVREDGALVLHDDAATRRSLEALLVEHTQGVDPAEALPGEATPESWVVRNGHGAEDEGGSEAAGSTADPRPERPNGPDDDAAIVVPTWRPLAVCLGLDPDSGLERTWADLPDEAREWPNAVEAVNAVAPVTVRERAPTRVGNRMGRPEKSESRELSPAVHALFPIGEAGGAQRDVAAAADHQPHRGATPGRVEVEVGRRRCRDCGDETFKSRCPDCGGHTDPHYTCPDCGQTVHPDESGRVHCSRCDVEASAVEPREVNVDAEYRDALAAVGERENAFDILKGVKGLTSTVKTPEPLAKGVLRSKHGVSAFKDGTVRYDMTDLPVTAVRPEELDVSAGRLRELGYETDVHGDPLRHDDQVVELKVQDVVLSEGAADHMVATADFVDDLLESFYGLDPFYEIDEREDLIGELVFGMAPHTSAATVARVVGFTTAAGGYAHPYFHAAKRRNCFHPDTKVWYEDENGRWRHERIERLVEDRIDETRAEADDFGAVVDHLDGESLSVPSVDEHGDVECKPVEAISRHPAPDHLVEVETETGREITVTPNHSMLRWDDDQGRIERVEARNLTAGDEVPVPTDRPGTDGIRQRPLRADGGSTNGQDTVIRTEIVTSDVENTYCLTIKDNHTLIAEDTHVGQCDGDEDCVMLLMDGLLNFSKYYLPDQRGGQMDAPLVMSSRIDPAEIDDEAHNVDIVEEYPLELYEASRELAHPEAVDVEIAEDRLGTDRETAGFGHTHDTTHIAAGPDLSAYKTLEDMQDKMDGQLELARKIRAVDETDVAERVIEYHFLPDLIGNLRAFSRQEVRCLDCGTKYRRPPLAGDCRECGGDVTLTVHEGSVTKYLETATRIAEEYGAREYTKQRLEVLEMSIESIFENDKNKQSGIADFM